MSRLFDYEAQPAWEGSTALVPVGTNTCPRCGGEPEVIASLTPALLIFGGYGETRGETVTVCVPCRLVVARESSSHNPREDA